MDDIRAIVAEVQSDPELLELRFRHQGTFTKVQNGRERPYFCHFSVQDPVQFDPGTVAAAQAFAAEQQVAFTDVRLLRVHPDFRRPPEGSTLNTPWDGGTLKVVRYAQPGDFTGQAPGLCLLTR